MRFQVSINANESDTCGINFSGSEKDAVSSSCWTRKWERVARWEVHQPPKGEREAMGMLDQSEGPSDDKGHCEPSQGHILSLLITQNFFTSEVIHVNILLPDHNFLSFQIPH